MRRAAVWCVLLLASVGAARAAGLPDWAREIAGSTEPPPAGIADAPSVTLLAETLYSVDVEGAVRTRRRVAVQALRSTAREVGIGTFLLGEDSKILRSRAWHVPPDGGRVKKVRATAAWDLTLQDVFLTDSQIRVIRVADVEKGSLIFFEFDVVNRPEVLGLHHLFLAGESTRVARVLVEAPPGWSVRHAWLRIDGPAPRVEGGTRIWELRDVQAVEREEFGVAAADRAPLLAVGVHPPDGRHVDVATPENWAELATWYEQLIAGTETASPSIEATARELGAAEDDPARRILRLATHVRDSVRYVAVSLGIGSIKPGHAGDTAARLWGDCKDKGTLLRSLLQAVDVTSYPILVNLSRSDTVAESVPSLHSFDHFVIGVRIADEIALPGRFDSATVEVPGIGRVLVIDTTDEHTAVGALSAALAGKTGLLVAGDESVLLTLPPSDPAAHRVDRRLEIDRSSEAATIVNLTTRLSGAFAANARRRHAVSAGDYRDSLERSLRKQWPDLQLGELEIEPEDESGRFEWTASFRLPLDSGDHSRSLAIFPGAMNGIPRVSLRRREAAVRFGFARHLHYETTIRGVLHDRPLEDGPHETTGEGWSVRYRAEHVGTVLRATWDAELGRREFDVDAFDELRRFMATARESSRAALESVEQIAVRDELSQ